MRVFIGIKLNNSVKEEINKVLRPFKKISTPLKWVKPENIHLTLKFIGEISEEKYLQIKESLTNNNFNIKPFNLKFSGLGRFGRGNNINIFWVGIENNNELKNLFKEIENRLENINIKKDTREFKPHITLGRNKKQFNFKSFFKILDEYNNQFISEVKVDSFQIFKSELSYSGPTHTILKEIQLGTT